MTFVEAKRSASGSESTGPDSPMCSSEASEPLAPVTGTFHGVNLANFHPRLVPAIPTPDAFKESPHHPLVVSPNPFAAAQQVIDGERSVTHNLGDVNGKAIPFESELMTGKMELHIRGAKSTQNERFAGKKRFVHVVLQARFKRPTVAGDFCIGQEMFSDASIPVWLSETLLTAAAKTFSATTRVSARTKPRYFMNPALACCQLINVARAGEEPGLWDAQEDVRLMFPRAVTTAGKPLTADQRRKWCDVPAHIDGATFNPDHVYTFHFWQHYADFANYKLSIGFLHVDLAPILHRSPLQLTAKDVGTGLYGFSVLAWNEKAVYGAAAGADEAAKAAEQQLKSQGLGSRLFSGMRSVLGGGGGH